MAGPKSRIVQGALGELIDATEIFKAKAEAREPKKIEGRELKKFMGASDEYLDATETGVRFLEKPGYWSEIEDSVSSSQLNDLEKVLGKKLNTYKIDEILGNPEYPLSDLIHANLKPEDQVRGSSFIVFDPENKRRYLANTSGADNYIRMWTGIEYD